MEKKTVDTVNNNEYAESASKSVPSMLSNSVMHSTMQSSISCSSITTYASMVAHWLDLTSIQAVNIDFASFAAHSLPCLTEDFVVDERKKSRTFHFNRNQLWYCQLCEQTFPMGYTWDQAMHMAEHKKKT